MRRVIRATTTVVLLISAVAFEAAAQVPDSFKSIIPGVVVGGPTGAVLGYEACKLQYRNETESVIKEKCRKAAIVGAAVGGVVGGVLGKLKDDRDKAARAAALDAAARSNAAQTYTPKYTPAVEKGTVTPTKAVAKNVPESRQCKVLSEQLIETSGATEQETTVCLNTKTSRWEEYTV